MAFDVSLTLGIVMGIVMSLRRSIAFTLLELMIVIAILALLAAAAIPDYLKYVRRSSIAESIAAFADYKIALGVYWTTQGTLPGPGDTLNSSPVDLPFGEIVTANLPDSMESIQLYESGEGLVIRIILGATVFSTFPENNRSIFLGIRTFDSELRFECGNFDADVENATQLGFIDITMLPYGCNDEGIGAWLAS